MIIKKWGEDDRCPRGKQYNQNNNLHFETPTSINTIPQGKRYVPFFLFFFFVRQHPTGRIICPSETHLKTKKKKKMNSLAAKREG